MWGPKRPPLIMSTKETHPPFAPKNTSLLSFFEPPLTQFAHVKNNIFAPYLPCKIPPFCPPFGPFYVKTVISAPYLLYKKRPFCPFLGGYFTREKGVPKTQGFRLKKAILIFYTEKKWSKSTRKPPFSIEDKERQLEGF